MGPSGRITHVIGYIAYIGLFGTGNWGLDLVYIYIVSRPLHIRGI